MLEIAGGIVLAVLFFKFVWPMAYAILAAAFGDATPLAIILARAQREEHNDPRGARFTAPRGSSGEVTGQPEEKVVTLGEVQLVITPEGDVREVISGTGRVQATAATSQAPDA